MGKFIKVWTRGFLISSGTAVVALAFILAWAVQRNSADHSDLIPAYLYVAPGAFPSPDGNYLAVETLDVCEVRNLHIRSTSAPNDSPPILEIAQTRGFCWVPGDPHTLVFAAGSEIGPGMIGLWDGTSLKNLTPTADPQVDYYRLNAVSRGGDFIVYNHARFAPGMSSEELWNQDRLFTVNRRLKLPKH
jgi:hypothetical protein